MNRRIFIFLKYSSPQSDILIRSYLPLLVISDSDKDAISIHTGRANHARSVFPEALIRSSYTFRGINGFEMSENTQFDALLVEFESKT
jgi:hypothetical protein